MLFHDISRKNNLTGFLKHLLNIRELQRNLEVPIINIKSIENFNLTCRGEGIAEYFSLAFAALNALFGPSMI